MKLYVRRRELIQRLNRQHLRPNVLRDRMNPFEFYDDDEFIRRYRFSKAGVRDLCDVLRNDLQRDPRGNPLSVELQVEITLRFYATGSFEKVTGDLFGVKLVPLDRTLVFISRHVDPMILLRCDGD